MSTNISPNLQEILNKIYWEEMRYTYTTFNAKGVRQDITTNIDEAIQIACDNFMKIYPGYKIEVHDNLTNKAAMTLTSNDIIDGWLEGLQRGVWRDQADKLNETEQLSKLASTWEPFNEAETGIHLKGTPKIELKEVSKINPPHYKDIVPGMQYMEMMQYMLHGKEGVEAHLLGQVYKYMMRNGKKDDDLQEYEKAKWYLDFLVAWLKNGKQPIKIADIEKILKA
jgi:hypothetical protein